MSRRYRQRGYQDEERPEGSSSGPRPAGERPEGPGGRGLGKPSATVFRCARCGSKIDLGAAVALDASCGGCGAALHSCTHCRHFDPSARFECREEIAAPVRSKAKSNECALFAPRWAKELDAGATGTARADDARTAFDDLFDF